MVPRESRGMWKASRWRDYIVCGRIRQPSGEQLGIVDRLEEKETRELLSRRIGTNDFVALDDGGNADTVGTIFRTLVDSNHFAHGANENFRTSSHFGGQNKRDVQFRARAHVLIDCEVDAASGNIARLPVARGDLF